MKRRVCETCLYFESAGFSQNGWCHHPARRQNSDVRLIVRANELACRNGWNADLWVSAGSGDDARREHPLDPIAGRARAEVAPAEQNDLITSIVAARTENIPVEANRTVRTMDTPENTGEDIFVNQSPVLPRKAKPVTDQPAKELVQDPKAAILRARDQFRERLRAEGRLADREISTSPATLVSSSREAHTIDDLDLAEPDPGAEAIDPRYENRPILQQPVRPSVADHRPVSPVALGEVERRFPSMTEFPDDRRRFESVPVLELDPAETDSVQASQVDTWIETRQLDTVPPEPYEFDDYFDEEERAQSDNGGGYEEEVEFSVHHRESVLDRFLRQRRERHHSSKIAAQAAQEDDARFLPVPPASPPQAEVPYEAELSHGPVERNSLPRQRREDMPYEDRAVHRDREWAETRAEVATQHAAPRVTQRSEHPLHRDEASTIDDDFILPPPLPAIAPEDRRAQSIDARPRQRYDSVPRPGRSASRNDRDHEPVSDEFGDQPLFAAAPTLPTEQEKTSRPHATRASSVPMTHQVERICRTCRDFRPAENGDRGWCNNKWAFNHRRMVDADDLACRNSMGGWWTPKDDVWRRDGDISRHAQQTPRVDEWFFGSGSESNERRRSGS